MTLAVKIRVHYKAVFMQNPKMCLAWLHLKYFLRNQQKFDTLGNILTRKFTRFLPGPMKSPRKRVFITSLEVQYRPNHSILAFFEIGLPEIK